MIGRAGADWAGMSGLMGMGGGGYGMMGMVGGGIGQQQQNKSGPPGTQFDTQFTGFAGTKDGDGWRRAAEQAEQAAEQVGPT